MTVTIQGIDFKITETFDNLKNQAHKSPVLYKSIPQEDSHYITQEEKIRVGTLAYYQTTEFLNLQDRHEGIITHNINIYSPDQSSPGGMKVNTDSPGINLIRQALFAEQTQFIPINCSIIRTSPPCYIFSMTTRKTKAIRKHFSKRQIVNGSGFGKIISPASIYQIKRFSQFKQIMDISMKEQGYAIAPSICRRITYTQRERVDTLEQYTNHPVDVKPSNYSHEFEWRLIWPTTKEVQEQYPDAAIIHIPGISKYFKYKPA